MFICSGWISLGAPASEFGRAPQDSGFIGSLSRVQVWGRALEHTKEIQKQVRGCKTESVIYHGLLLPWNGYDRFSGGVERVVPSVCGERVCAPGLSGSRCDVMLMDKTPPQITHCPGPMWVTTKNGSATVTWDEPVFSDNIGIVRIEEKQGFRPGQTLLWGNYDIAYVAYDQAGNNAVCQFKVYVLGKQRIALAWSDWEVATKLDYFNFSRVLPTDSGPGRWVTAVHGVGTWRPF